MIHLMTVKTHLTIIVKTVIKLSPVYLTLKISDSIVIVTQLKVIFSFENNSDLQ